MLREIAFVARRDVLHSLRLPQVWVWMFIMPLVLSYIIGSLMAGLGGRVERLALFTADRGFLASDLARRLGAAGYELTQVGDPALLKEHPIGLSIPAGFTDSVLAGTPVELDLKYPAGYSLLDWERYRVNRAVTGMAADLALLSSRGVKPDASAVAALAAETRKLELRVESAGRQKKLIFGFQQTVPGFIVMFTLMVCLTSGSILLLVERRRGLLRRLASTPISRASIVTGKLAARLGLACIQVAVAMLAGKWLFHVTWGGPNLWAVLALLGAYTGLCAALALLLSSIARNEGQALAAGVIAANVLAALGGCWWPVEITPAWMQQAALLLPTGWAMNGLHKLISYGEAPASVLPNFAALAVAALAAGCIAVRRFRLE